MQDEQRPLRVGLVLADPNAARPDSARLVEILDDMDLVDLVCIVASGEEATSATSLMSSALALETAVTRQTARDVPIPGLHDREILPADPAIVPDLDLILDDSGIPAVEELAGNAEHGIWRLSTVDPESGLHAAVINAPVTPVRLWSFTSEEEGWRRIAETEFDTKFLASRNLLFQREKAVRFLTGQLARLALCEVPVLEELPDEVPDDKAASVLQLPQYVGRVAAEAAVRSANTIRARMGGRPGRFCLRLAEGTALTFDPVSAVEFDAPAGSYWADPFLIAHRGEVHVFFEVFDYRSGRGHIAAGRLNEGRLDFVADAIRTSYHLSYPFVFQHGDDIFMLPETSEGKRLELWRATDFPLGWTLHATAMEGVSASDSTLAKVGRDWWLFTNLCEDSFDDFCSELHLFRVDGPDLAEITPHPMNPVVVNSRTARGAGRVFQQDGRLFRPSQDNSHGTYGYGLNIMEIEALDMDRYQEKLVRHITPRQVPGTIGIHHIDVLDGQVIFDVRKR